MMLFVRMMFECVRIHSAYSKKNRTCMFLFMRTLIVSLAPLEQFGNLEYTDEIRCVDNLIFNTGIFSFCFQIFVHTFSKIELTEIALALTIKFNEIFIFFLFSLFSPKSKYRIALHTCAPCFGSQIQCITLCLLCIGLAQLDDGDGGCWACMQRCYCFVRFSFGWPMVKGQNENLLPIIYLYENYWPDACVRQMNIFPCCLLMMMMILCVCAYVIHLIFNNIKFQIIFIPECSVLIAHTNRKKGKHVGKFI